MPTDATSHSVAEARTQPARRLIRPAMSLALVTAAILPLALPQTEVDAGSGTVQCSRSDYGCTTGGYAGHDPWGYWQYGSTNQSGPHNCTAYAAFKLSTNGAANPGNLGNATDWATNARKKGIRVDSTPAVGSIAQWNSGHVAYVEEVGAGYIITTDDNYGYNVTTRQRRSPGSAAWPDNFIHLKDVAAMAPAITKRLAFTRLGDGALFRVEPGGWQAMAGPGASSVAVDGQAMAMIVPWQGAIYRINDSSPWVTIRDISSHPTSVAVADNGRLAFTADDGAWYRASESGPWQHMAGPGASSVAVDGQAMAMIVPWQGAIYRDNDSSPWVTIRDMSSHPTSVAVADNGRLAFTADDGAWYRPSDAGPWQQMAGPGASKVAVDKYGMAMIVPWQGAIYRDNDNSPWVTITGQTSNPTSVAIAR